MLLKGKDSKHERHGRPTLMPPHPMPDTSTQLQHTPMHTAVNRSDTEVMALLLAHCADRGIQNIVCVLAAEWLAARPAQGDSD